MKTAVGYLRRSTDKQDTSLDDQRQAIKRYAKQHGYELLRFYEDDAISGTSVDGRTDFQKMIKAAKESSGHPPFQAILTWDVRRFSRGDNDEAGYYRFLLRQHGVEVVYISENFRGDDTDDLILGTKQWLARQESKDKSRDVIRGQLPRIQQGYSSPGHPYGYYRQVIGPDGRVRETLKRGEKRGKRPDDRVKLVPGDPQEIAIVRRIFDCYANRGMGKWTIARMLNTEGVPPPRAPRSKRWGICAVDFILKNHAYLGWLVYNKTGKAKFHRIAKQGDGQFGAEDKGKLKAGKFERHPESAWVIVKRAHDPIIPEGLFWKAQRVRQQRAETGNCRGHATISPYLWTGLIHCQRCGRHLCGSTQRGVHNRWLYYSCPGCLVLPKRKKTPVPARALDDYILGRIQERLQQPERIAGLVNALEQELERTYEDATKSGESLEAKLKANSEAIDRLLDAVDPRHRDLLNRRLDELRKEREGLEAALERLRSQPAPIHAKRLAHELAGQARDFRRVFAEGTMPERKAFVRAYVAGITVNARRREAIVGFYRLPQLPSLTEQVLTASGSRSARPGPS